MSQIVTAIDAEIEEESEKLRAIRSEVETRENRIADLDKLRQAAVALNGGGKVPVADPPKKPATRRKPKQEPAPKVSDEDRTERVADVEGEQAKVLAYVREHGEIDRTQAAELLGVTPETAAKKLVAMCAHGRTQLRTFTGKRPEGATSGRPPKVYRLTAAEAKPDDGPKTRVEERVVDSITTDGPIDEGTLAFNCNLSLPDVRSVATGLKRRGVLASYVDEGVTLWKVAT